MFRVWFGLFVCLSVLFGVSGCGGDSGDGPEMVKVTGTVLLDGNPVEDALVCFSPQGAGTAAFGESGENGKFTLRTAGLGDGAVPGKYAVTVTRESVQGGMEFESEAEKQAYIEKQGKQPPSGTSVNELPENYARAKTSGLTAELSIAENEPIVLELKSE
jgi:hypothetical protein